MSNVWLCIPSARPAHECGETLQKWLSRGYYVALFRDQSTDPPPCNLLLSGEYPGYARAVNAMAAEVFKRDPNCCWIVTGGDDTEPDANAAPADVAAQCESHFGGTFGVMQPTGDRWGDHGTGAYIDRVAGSPWIGREFCRKVNGGTGPLWHEYAHMGVDEELQAVAQKLGVFWQRPDLTHHHKHWGRSGRSEDMPAFLRKANSAVEWQKYKNLFQSRANAGFPGHHLLIR